ncbi:diacylglycerol kinase family protein [Thermospira aquatica]|uniref:Diacylglycerol kinase family protein n=1 Tax=Thermospira aquatica TaxID=2828656 RepID=A0AAX3BB96_9SPIR|nr:diacylglycerol kinase family protein [Thermospira aquatica]URA09583.1 diacylglycerol kinase family protein [Thermospira aquatica]
MFRRHSHPWWKSFIYAYAGLRRVFLRERNFRFHLVVATMVIVAGILFRLTFIEWAIIFLAIGLVLGLETVNTSVEAICDVIKPEKHGSVRRIKDMAAGAVMIASLTSAMVGVVILGPHAWNWFMRVIGSK